MALVLDASMALSWLFERIDKKEIKLSEKALSLIVNEDVFVPALFHIEVSNALVVAERRKVVTEAHIIDYLAKLSDLPIITDDVSIVSRRDMTLFLAREHGLSAYDATYLDLALRKEAVLATFDKKFATATKTMGGEILT